MTANYDFYSVNKGYFSPSFWALPILSAVILAVISFYNTLLFHTLAEFFAITVAILTCVVAWNMYPFTRNNYLMYLGAGYFWIGLLDLMHALNYEGINIFVDGGTNTAVQIWLGTRYLEALLLITAPWFLKNNLNRNKVFIVYGIVATVIIFSVKEKYFPISFIEGKGLTAFKIYSEYAIILLLAASIYYLVKLKSLLDPSIVNAMIISIVLTMCAELSFTFYVSAFGLSNIAGHVFKLFSFWLIFMAVIRTTLREPFLAMSKGATTYDAIPDAAIVIDETGIIRQANNSACLLANQSLDQLVGKNNHNTFHPEHFLSENCPICQSIQNKKELKAYECKVDEYGSWYDFTISPILSNSNFIGTVEVIRDITQRKLNEDKIIELDSLKNSIIENLPSMLFVKDANDHRYLEWNKAAEDLTGLLKEDILGNTDFKFWPKDEAQFFIDKDNEVIKNKKLIEITSESITTKSNGTRILHTKKIPIYDSEGKAKYLLGISEDVTDILQTQEMLNRSQKMEVVGQMSGGIAHDFNNQLGVILGYTELLSELALDKKQLGWLNSVQLAAERCADLTRQLLIFSRNGEIDTAQLNVNDLIDEMKGMVEGSLTPAVDVEYILSNDLWVSNVNKGSCQDAVLNLVINAHDAMVDGGSLKIQTQNIVLDDKLPSLLPGEYVQILVSDSGAGIAREVVEHIFEPFYTTKDVGKGTGLGLSMVYAFAKRSGGDIVLDTEVGVGSTFKIYLPRVTGDEDKENEAVSIDNDFLRGTENILVVDDEPALLSLAENSLRMCGYNVYPAENAENALAILKATNIDVLFSDVVMPGMLNGYELATKALEINPEIKILLTSGFSGKDDHEEEFQILPKPYERKVLFKRLRELLDENK